MSDPMVATIRDMLAVQNTLNCETIGDDWRKHGNDWLLALHQEAAELIDHLGWKWWKNNIVDKEAAKVEVIDMLHFALSFELVAMEHPTDPSNLPEWIKEGYLNRTQPVYLDDAVFFPQEMEPIELAQLISSLTMVKEASTELVLLLGEKLDMTFNDQARLYRMKATLNLFRQNNGYKDGTYKKMWAEGLEDNDFLEELAKEIDWNSGDASKVFYNRLEETYARAKEEM